MVWFDTVLNTVVYGDQFRTPTLTRVLGKQVTSGSRGGGAPGAPPLTAADLCVFYAQNAIFFSKFSSLASLASIF